MYYLFIVYSVLSCTHIPLGIFSVGYWYYWKDLAQVFSGHEYILIAIDYFTKWVEAASYAKLTTAKVAKFIRSHIICRYGVPHELISDKGAHSKAR